MRTRVGGRSVATIFTLLLTCIFALTVLIVLLLGADVYRRVADSGDAAFSERAGPAYIAARLRRADTSGGVSVGEFGGVPALSLCEEHGGVEYETLIYCSDGYIRELLREKGVTLDPSAGAEIAPARSLAFELDESGLVTVLCDGRELYVALRSGGAF